MATAQATQQVNMRRMAIIIGIAIVAIIALFALTKLSGNSSSNSTSTPVSVVRTGVAPTPTTASTLPSSGGTRDPFSAGG